MLSSILYQTSGEFGNIHPRRYYFLSFRFRTIQNKTGCEKSGQKKRVMACLGNYSVTNGEPLADSERKRKWEENRVKDFI